jgi:hypothetical protein
MTEKQQLWETAPENWQHLAKYRSDQFDLVAKSGCLLPKDSRTRWGNGITKCCAENWTRV